MMGTYYLIEKSPFFYTKALEIKEIYTCIEDTYEKNNIYKIKTGQEEYYVFLSRAIEGGKEQNLVKEQCAEIINERKSDGNVYKLNDGKCAGGKLYFPTTYRNTVIYGSLNIIGNSTMVFSFVVTLIICIALYFPIVRGIINLFKKKV